MFRHASRWLGAVVLLSLIGCAADEPAADLATLTARLDGCPRGDIPWYDAVRAAAASDDAENALESLLRRTESLVEICSDRWEPIWAGAECLYRLRPLESSAGFERATERARALDEPSGVARATNRLALLDYRAGRLTEGEARFVEALAAAESAERPDLEAFVLNNYAGLLLEMGRFAEARDRLETAAQGLEQLGLVDAARAARFNRGVIHLELGDAGRRHASPLPLPPANCHPAA